MRTILDEFVKGIFVSFLALSLIIVTEDMSMANDPKFVIDNTLIREQSYDLGGWIYTDSLIQNYNLDWSEKVTERLSVATQFILTIEDSFFSEDVDKKTVTPSFTVNLINPVWDFSFEVKDIILFTNEFNKYRRDNWEYATTFRLVPDFLPVLEVKYNLSDNFLVNLEDKTEEKIDVNMTHEIWGKVTLDGTFIEKKNNDQILKEILESQEWTVSVAYGQILMPSIKLDESLSIGGSREVRQDFRLSPASITDSGNQTFENKAKFTFLIFPAIEAELEMLYKTGKADESTEQTTTFNMSAIQEILSLGTLKETVELETSDLVSGTEDDEKFFARDFNLELSGVPSRYIDFSTSLGLTLEDSESEGQPGSSESVNRKFDFSLTSNPMEETTLELAYNRSGQYTDGALQASGRELNISLNFENEYIGMPGLSFKPTINMSNSWDRVGGVFNKTKSLNLIFSYENPYPSNYVFTLEPSYQWNKSGSQDPDVAFNIDYEVTATFYPANGEIQISNKGNYEDTLSDDIKGGKFTLDKEFTFYYETRFTGGLSGKVDYAYKVPYEGDNSDSIKLEMNYRYKSSSLDFICSNNRIFSGVKQDVRKYELNFGMRF